MSVVELLTIAHMLLTCLFLLTFVVQLLTCAYKLLTYVCFY